MRATELLRSEHRVIEAALNRLERLTDECAWEGTLDLAGVRQVIEFLRGFADRNHRDKEEKHLFRLIEAHGLTRDHGPTGWMVHEHHLAHQFLDNLAQVTEDAAAGTPDAYWDFVDQARSYVALMREHIRMEDERLFPIADEVLTDREQQLLLEVFSQQQEDLGTYDHAQYLRLAERLGSHDEKVAVGVGASQHPEWDPPC